MSTTCNARSLLALAIAMAFSVSVAQAQTAHPPTSSKTTKAFTEASAPSGGAPLLYDQTGSPSFDGILAMTNLDAGQQTFDTELADDFDVPAGGWAISTIRMGTFYHSGGTPVRPSTSGNITFYSDTGSGRPGAAIAGCTYRNVSLFYNEGFITSVLTLPDVCALPQGHYWMGFSGNLSYDDQEGGVYVTQETGSPGGTVVWRNPGGGYASGGCTDWSAPTSCALARDGGMTFQLYGQTTPVTLQQFSVD